MIIARADVYELTRLVLPISRQFVVSPAHRLAVRDVDATQYDRKT